VADACVHRRVQSSLLALFVMSKSELCVAGDAVLIGSVIIGPRRVIMAAVVPLLRAVIGQAMRDTAMR